jgi:hypothetical protein
MTFLGMTDRFLRSAKVVAAMIVLTGAPGAAWAQGASKPLSASGAAERQQAAYPDTVLASSRGRVDYRNASFWLDERLVKLKDGMAEQPAAPGSASMNKTHIVEPPAPASGRVGGRQVTALVLADEPGGSGTFYYVAIARSGGGSTHAVFLGDRVVLESIALERGEVSVRYLDRKASDAMTTQPSVAMERRFTVKRDRLIEQVGAAEKVR